MRENRTCGSEGGEAQSLPYPYHTDGHRYWMELGRGSVAALSSSVFICVHLWFDEWCWG